MELGEIMCVKLLKNCKALKNLKNLSSNQKSEKIQRNGLRTIFKDFNK